MMAGKSSSSKVRAAIRRQRRQQQIRNRILWIGGGLIAVALVGFFAWSALRAAAQTSNLPLMGTPFPITSRNHVPTDQPPGPYNSDPPTNGAHYPSTLPARFYNESDLASLPSHPEGYLVHNLEHGYVIFWYNCQADPAIDCNTLKQQIQSVMNEYGGTKLIAFPWKTLDVPVAMTSWGRLLKLKSVDLDIMRQFVRSNRYQAPEPTGE